MTCYAGPTGMDGRAANPMADWPVSDIMFRGLAVRMVIATGSVEKCTKHPISNRVEYQGSPLDARPKPSCSAVVGNLLKKVYLFTGYVPKVSRFHASLTHLAVQLW